MFGDIDYAGETGIRVVLFPRFFSMILRTQRLIQQELAKVVSGV
jgi:hypothetical protein